MHVTAVIVEDCGRFLQSNVQTGRKSSRVSLPTSNMHEVEIWGKDTNVRQMIGKGKESAGNNYVIRFIRVEFP
jgi:hypothetical protein